MIRTVLMHPPPEATNSSPYVRSLSEALRAQSYEVVGLSITSMLRHRTAVVHIHWPEHFFGDASPTKSIAKLAVGRTILMLVRRMGNPLVWTAHNLAPHDAWPFGAERSTALFHRSLDAVVTLCEGQQSEVVRAFPAVSAAEFTVAPEGQLHRHEVFPERPNDGGPVRLLHMGALSPYKRQQEVLAGLAPLIFEGLVELKIVGRSAEDEYGQRVRAQVSELAGAELIDRRVPDEELLELIGWCDAAVGVQNPAFNTGVAAAVLPLGRPVVLSPSTQCQYLANRVGSDWVTAIESPTDDGHWRSVVDWVKKPRGPVSTDLFRWSIAANEHVAIYADVTDC